MPQDINMISAKSKEKIFLYSVLFTLSGLFSPKCYAAISENEALFKFAITAFLVSLTAITAFIVYKISASEHKEDRHPRTPKTNQDSFLRTPKRFSVSMEPNEFPDILGAVEAGAELPDKFALVIVQPPNHETLNNSLGYLQCNKLLDQIADTLNKTVSQVTGAIFLSSHTDNDVGSYVFRIERPQFAFFLDCSQKDDQAITRVRKILSDLEGSFVANDKLVFINFCAGISFSNSEQLDLNELLRQAQIATSLAPNNNYKIERYRKGIESIEQEQLSLVTHIQRAIESHCLETRYQPQIDFDNKTIRGLEAQVIWNSPKFGTIDSEKIIKSAELSGKTQSLTEWMIKNFVEDISLIYGLIPELSVSINISSAGLLQPPFPFELYRKLNQEDIPISSIKLEVSENLLLKNDAFINQLFSDFKENGIAISIGNFGTSQGSLENLKKFQIDEIKIDHSFIENIENNKIDQVIVKNIINMCHNMDIQVVAEGVDRIQSFELLKTYNCDLGQGRLFAPPLSISDLMNNLSVYSGSDKIFFKNANN